MLISVLAAVAIVLACPPLPGAASLFVKPQTRVIWVGEIHGTIEMPQLFGDLVCAAAETGRPIVVALERSHDEQPLWDAFLASDGGKAARAALTHGVEWSSRLQDGRSSRAILALAERLRRLKTLGRIVGVRMIIADDPGDTPAKYEASMADGVSAAETYAPKALVLAYSGNVHAEKIAVSFGGQTYRPAAANLPADEVVSINIKGEAGRAWDCIGATCGPHPAGVQMAHHDRAIALSDTAPGYDAVAYTGGPTTPSPPAARPATPINLDLPLLLAPKKPRN